MKELVEVLAKSLVDYPEQVTVTETEQDNEILLVLKVASDDMGKRRCDEHWYVNYVAGHHVRYDVFLNDPSAEERTEKTAGNAE